MNVQRGYVQGGGGMTANAAASNAANVVADWQAYEGEVVEDPVAAMNGGGPAVLPVRTGRGTCETFWRCSLGRFVSEKTYRVQYGIG